jgi:hypothetical protein
MRFFKTQLPSVAYRRSEDSDIYFYTRETNPSRESRYSVRVFHPSNGKIETVGEFHSIRGVGHARKATIAAAGGA